MRISDWSSDVCSSDLKVAVGSDVSGRIVSVNVRENQHVNAGDILFRIDPEPYQVALAQAKASIASAHVDLQKLHTDYSATGVDISSAQEDIRYAKLGRASCRERECQYV